jgi:hypothetical protein
MIRVVLSCDTCDAEIRGGSHDGVLAVARRKGWGHAAGTKRDEVVDICPECSRLDALEAKLRQENTAAPV